MVWVMVGITLLNYKNNSDSLKTKAIYCHKLSNYKMPHKNTPYRRGQAKHVVFKDLVF